MDDEPNITQYRDTHARALDHASGIFTAEVVFVRRPPSRSALVGAAPGHLT
jgi:hypothetical protein